MSSTLQSDTRALFLMPSGQVDPADKNARILKAALDLFVRYGIKRTSIDEIAHAAGIAKGTLYLYYPSKNALFTAIAERVCAERLAMARAAAARNQGLVETLVNILDCHFGIMYRLVVESPHIAELLESRAFAAATHEKFEEDMNKVIVQVLSREGLGARADAPQMLTACAIGTIKSCGADEGLFHQRLTAIVETLILGLRSRAQLQKKSARTTDLCAAPPRNK